MARDEIIAKITTLRKQGKSYDEIAKALGRSPQRIGWYVRTFVEKNSAQRKKTNAAARAKAPRTKKPVTKKTAAKKTTKPAAKTETKGARRAREAQEAYGRAHGLTKKTDTIEVRPQPKSVSARKPKPVADKIPAPAKVDLAKAAADVAQG